MATSTAVTSSLNPSTTGANVTFTATVTSGGSPVTAGTVTFTEGTTTLQANVALNAQGQATFTTTTLAEGTHTDHRHVQRRDRVPHQHWHGHADRRHPDDDAGDRHVVQHRADLGVAAAGPATPYPSRITVSGAGQSTTRVTVQLGGVSHQVPVDLDVLLVGPAGQNIMLMSDVGGQRSTDARQRDPHLRRQRRRDDPGGWPTHVRHVPAQ